MSAGGFSLRHLFIVDDAQKEAPAPSTDIDALFNGAQNPPAPPPSASTSPVSGDQNLILPEGVELAAIYAQAGVPAAAFPIEKLAKLIEGMNQLDAATKKTVVAAMDAADDLWDIASVIADGKAKRAALTAYKGDVASGERAINDEIARRLDANQADKAARLADIDRQIAALQGRREETISETSTVAATLRVQGSAAAEAAERERNRIDDAIRGLDGLIALFDTAAASASST
jgi:hypothetical protein